LSIGDDQGEALSAQNAAAVIDVCFGQFCRIQDRRNEIGQRACYAHKRANLNFLGYRGAALRDEQGRCKRHEFLIHVGFSLYGIDYEGAHTPVRQLLLA